MDSRSLSSRLHELLQFLATTKGDLANVTGPPAMLAPSSVVEVGHCWAQRPAVFAAPALEPAADRRCLLVLRMVLIALRSQLYVGGSPSTSIKKPLNAFLGELFLAEWTEGEGESDSEGRSDGESDRESDSEGKSKSRKPKRATTRLVAEQVSHHPPITAMHIADEAHGVRADGYARVEMAFAGSVQVRQVGHAIVRVDRYDEEYLIPLPAVRVRGFLSGCLYPEIDDVYHIVGSSGYAAEIRFSGQGLAWGGTKNAFVAEVFDRGNKKNEKKTVLYIVEGVWSDRWTVRDARSGAVLERYVVDAPANAPAPIRLPALSDQDPWESRRAWDRVIDGIARGHLAQTVAEKTRIEQAQRRMRAQEAARGAVWEPLFFRSIAAGHPHDTFHRLAAGTGCQLHADRTKGVWRVDEARLQTVQRPFRGTLTPLG